MPAERHALLPLLLALAAGGAQAAPPQPVSAPATDAELLEFLGEFSADDGKFVDPFALDKVGKALEEEISKLDATAAKASKPAPPASKEKEDDGH